jgi:hypothetical protein
MADIKKLTLDIRGKLSIRDNPNSAAIRQVVFQGTSAQFANYLTPNGQPRMERAYVIQTPSRTPRQAAMRNKMQSAVIAWRSATENQLLEAKKIAESRAISVYMAFISQFLKNTPSNQTITWDKNPSLWDNGASQWDGTTNSQWDKNPSLWDSGASEWIE